MAAIQAEAKEAAKGLEVDDFVDTYLRERPKTRNPFDPVRVGPPPPPTASRPGVRAPSPSEESGIRVARAHRVGDEVRRPTVEVEAVAVAGADGEVVALEAELAEREERIESLEQELKRLRDSVSDDAGHAAPMGVAAPIAAAPAPTAAPASARSDAAVTASDPRPAPPVPVRPVARRGAGRRALGIALVAGAAISLALGVARLATDDTPSAMSSKAPTAPAERAGADAPGPSAAPPGDGPLPEVAIAEPPHAPAPPSAPPAAPVPSAAVTPPTEVPAEPEDAPGLLSFQGHLTVQSTVDAEVVVQGQPAGRTNQRILTRCGPRNVRLRNGTTWITEGEHVRIVCMKHTSIRLEPSGEGR